MSLPIAIQLYSVRDTMQKDPEGTLISLKEMGYSAVEFAGLYGKTAQEMRELCDRVGLIPISSHIGFPSICDELERHIEESVALGVKYVGISYMHTDFHIGGLSHDGVYDSIKEISARFREKGITLLYHNHSFEMCEYEGKRLYEWLFDAMTPEELQPEIDTGWIDVEVGEAEKYIRKFKDRCAATFTINLGLFALITFSPPFNMSKNINGTNIFRILILFSKNKASSVFTSILINSSVFSSFSSITCEHRTAPPGAGPVRRYS